MAINVKQMDTVMSCVTTNESTSTF